MYLLAFTSPARSSKGLRTIDTYEAPRSNQAGDGCSESLTEMSVRRRSFAVEQPPASRFVVPGELSERGQGPQTWAPRAVEPTADRSSLQQGPTVVGLGVNCS